MTTNKAYFNQWLKRTGVGEVLNNFPRLPIVEVRINDVKKLDPRYIMCISGQPGTLTDGTVNSGLVLLNNKAPLQLTIFFVRNKEDALKVLNNPVVIPTINHFNRRGTGTTAPSSVNAFKAWCDRHSIALTLCQRMAHFDPATIGIKAPQRDYYWCEFDSSSLDSDLLLDNIPHKFETRDGIRLAIALVKAGGQYKPKKTLLIEKALLAARLQRTEKAARFYVELFLQHSVAGVNIENIDWNAPDVGMQLVNNVVMVNPKEEIDVVDTTVPADSPLDF